MTAIARVKEPVELGHEAERCDRECTKGRAVTTGDENWAGAELAVDFRPGVRSYFTEGVIDYEGDGTLLGVEILGLLADCHGLEDPNTGELQQAGLMSVSIDRDADAIYLRVRNGRATHQEVRRAVVLIDEEHRLYRVHLSAGR